MDCCEASMTFVELLEHTADASIKVDERTKHLPRLCSFVKSGEFRDSVFVDALYMSLFQLVVESFTWKHTFADMVEQIFLGVTRASEFDVSHAESFISYDFLCAICSRVETLPSQHSNFLSEMITWIYAQFLSKRTTLRTQIGQVLRRFVRLPQKTVFIAPLLLSLSSVIRGFQTPLSKVHKRLLTEILLPLHRPGDWLLWDRQTPLIATYHKELVLCLIEVLEKQANFSVQCIESILAYLPSCREACTPKEVLLLHEIDIIMNYVDGACMPRLLPDLLRHLARLLGSQNAQTIQSVLKLWKNNHIAELFKNVCSQLIPQLLPVLLRGGDIFWNPTVNRMTCLVLEKLEESDPSLFEHMAEQLWGLEGVVPAFEIAETSKSPDVHELETKNEGCGSCQSNTSITSLKFGMGGWRPPVSGLLGQRAGSSVGGSRLPPVLITGVAPWAFKPTAASRSGPLSRISVTDTVSARTQLAPIGEIAPEKVPSGLERVNEYMRRWCPQGREESGEATTSWDAASMAEAPTFLPTLRFHQLVFGSSPLGSGSFSVVYHARAIQKGETQSHWPEYAVKVINMTTIEEKGYQHSVNREICILRMLSHPGISRMVSSFRWRDGAYLVLEYAAKGDLHSIPAKQGSLDEDAARFLLGEVVAALTAIHDIGFVYSDLKPENIVVTKYGHAKLTDFGACRPVTPVAQERCCKYLLGDLRDGDWRTKGVPDNAVNENNADQSCELVDPPTLLDSRFEGTTDYLAPEVVRGGVPSFASDAWALGCVAYQMLTGRPPDWAESELEEEVCTRIVTFSLTESLSKLFQLSEKAQELICRLLTKELAERASVNEVHSFTFFDGVDIFSLYRQPRGPELLSGATALPTDARWQKRQLSKIWSVMPTAEDYTLLDKDRAASETADKHKYDLAETCTEQESPFGDPMLSDLMPPLPRHH